MWGYTVSSFSVRRRQEQPVTIHAAANSLHHDREGTASEGEVASGWDVEDTEQGPGESPAGREEEQCKFVAVIIGIVQIFAYGEAGKLITNDVIARPGNS